MHLLDGYKKAGYRVFMENFYTGLDLFHDLLIDEKLQFLGQCNQEEVFSKNSLLQRLNSGVILYNHKMLAMRLFDRKHVTLLSIAYGSRSVNTGRKHWLTKERISKPETVHVYNKFMGGIDLNGQLLKYSAFSQCSLKWWKKVSYRLLDIAMVNNFIMYKVWLSTKPSTKNKHVTQTNLIKAMISKAYISNSTQEFIKLNWI